jgi:hypothetical protein
MIIDDNTLEELEAAVFGEELPVVECTNPDCGHVQEVEPDADYPCPVCKEGRLVSPLRALGLI